VDATESSQQKGADAVLTILILWIAAEADDFWQYRAHPFAQNAKEWGSLR
jgi:hypothetical protein